MLHDVHWTGSVSRLIAAQTGAIVAPAGAYYNYYRAGDRISIHTDSYGHALVLLTLLRGPVEPLNCHLDLVDTALGGDPEPGPGRQRIPRRGHPV